VCQSCDTLTADATRDRTDPTGTRGIVRRFDADIGRRFRTLKSLIREAIVKNDVLGMRPNPTATMFQAMFAPRQITRDDAPPAGAFRFQTSSGKVDAFMAWLRLMQDEHIFEITTGAALGQSAEQAWTSTYIRAAYEKGVADAIGRIRDAGGRASDDWIRSAFFRPIHADRAGLIFTRTYSDLRGITDEMDKQISRVLSEGIIRGRGPVAIARDLVDRVDRIGVTRARVMSRTEVISAHAEASLNSYEEAGIEGVNLVAEWLLGSTPCPLCTDAAAKSPYKISETHGLIPLHPNCVCAWGVEVLDPEKIDLG